MAPPSKLAVATSSVLRLVKEEASYHKEMAQQEARIKKLEEGSAEENAEYQLKQEVRKILINLYPAIVIMGSNNMGLQTLASSSGGNEDSSTISSTKNYSSSRIVGAAACKSYKLSVCLKAHAHQENNKDAGGTAPIEEVIKATDAVAEAKKSIGEIS